MDSCGLGWLLEGQTNAYSYALVKLRERINWDADFTLKWKMETDSAGTNHNGYLAFGSAVNETNVIRAGLEREAGRLVITEPGAGGESDLTGLTFPSGVLDLEVAYARADNSLTLRLGHQQPETRPERQLPRHHASGLRRATSPHPFRFLRN